MNRVQYIDIAGTLVIGQPAIVKPYDHPKDSINRSWVRTTPVQQIIEGNHGPVFRTQNTIYRPVDGYEPLPVGEVEFRDYSKTPFKQLPAEVHV